MLNWGSDNLRPNPNPTYLPKELGNWEQMTRILWI